ncbi:helix-turn-helix domain-containing protein [Paenibacillus typhae]|uniref:YSIRK-targeted surface antigen transcriptional regulator n=1 Tax=Paenibacillus typhae TaxID=1174501 RepID=A0A1G8FDX9_9BACL|nr:helix-turn-helix domain-containing protein [Paenibacillus typhae]SDH80340.1 YSIRK-targeted surface antigen transcriptional regulator [Paenibacillus typhae]
MSLKDIYFLLDSFYNITGLPIRYYSNEQLVRMLPDIPSYLDPVGKALPVLAQDEFNVSYHVSEDFLFYGKITNDGLAGEFILGPGYYTPLTKNHLSKIMIHSTISYQHSTLFAEFITKIPLISFEGFLNSLCFFNFALTRKRITVEKLLMTGNHFNSFEADIKNKMSQNLYETETELTFHNTYTLEQQIIEFVRTGDVERLKALFENSVRGKGGLVAKDALRQEKNIFIASVTLVTRAAIEGGLDMETAYHLSDTYIQQSESLSRLDTLSFLRQQMVFDFAGRVAMNEIPEKASLITIECIQSIKKNINSIILVSKIASDLGVSASYISRRFNEDMGISLSSYIHKIKMEEARKLLAFSDKPLSEISNYLCFSSQSYFQNQFKKYTGETPLKYRNSFRNCT